MVLADVKPVQQTEESLSLLEEKTSGKKMPKYVAAAYSGQYTHPPKQLTQPAAQSKSQSHFSLKLFGTTISPLPPSIKNSSGLHS